MANLQLVLAVFAYSTCFSFTSRSTDIFDTKFTCSARNTRDLRTLILIPTTLACDTWLEQRRVLQIFPRAALKAKYLVFACLVLAWFAVETFAIG